MNELGLLSKWFGPASLTRVETIFFKCELLALAFNFSSGLADAAATCGCLGCGCGEGAWVVLRCDATKEGCLHVAMGVAASLFRVATIFNCLPCALAFSLSSGLAAATGCGCLGSCKSDAGVVCRRDAVVALRSGALATMGTVPLLLLL